MEDGGYFEGQINWNYWIVRLKVSAWWTFDYEVVAWDVLVENKLIIIEADRCTHAEFWVVRWRKWLWSCIESGLTFESITTNEWLYGYFFRALWNKKHKRHQRIRETASSWPKPSESLMQGIKTDRQVVRSRHHNFKGIILFRPESCKKVHEAKISLSIS